MILLDVNVLVYAYRDDAPDHEAYRGWLGRASTAQGPLGAPDVVLSGFVRIVTHPRVMDPPASIDQALEFVDVLRSRPSYVSVAPGPRHWGIFARLCRESGAKGNLVPDAYLAAVAIELGGELATADRGFARFPGLRWRHPLATGSG